MKPVININCLTLFLSFNLWTAGFCAEQSTASERGVVTSVDAGVATIGSAGRTVAADYTLRNSRVDLSLAHARKAIRSNPDDMESHRALAEALEQKLASQEEVDPHLLHQCLQEWLVIFRSEVGEEKGLGFRGVGFAGHLFKDDEYAIYAKQRLIKLVGRAPKPWETDARYLKAAMRDVSVVGKILKKENSPKN